MTKPQHFGTDGLRGVANVDLLAPEQVLALGRALGRLARKSGTKAALARDPRRSSPLIAGVLASGIAAEGADVVDLGVLATPGLASLLPSLGARLGVMVSASHNQMRDNGIKVLTSDGGKITEDEEFWLEQEMLKPPVGEPPTGALVGEILEQDDAVDRYVDYLSGHFSTLDLSGLKVVVDAANGVSSSAGPLMLERLGATVLPLFVNPDGININEGCGAVHPEVMAREVVERGADMGVAFDGDGDRAIFASGDGSVQDGDHTLYICGRRLLEEGRLADNVIVGTVMSNFGFELALKDLGVRLVRTPVGDRHVAVALRENGWSIGGEQSGHLIFGARNNFIGDGLYSALETLSAMVKTGKPLHVLAEDLRPVPQVLLNVRVKAKPPVESLTDVQQKVSLAESELAESGRVLVRYSGTENLLRVMVEGRDGDLVSRSAEEIADAVRKQIGAADS